MERIDIIHKSIMKISSKYLETPIGWATRTKNIFVHVERLNEGTPYNYGDAIV